MKCATTEQIERKPYPTDVSDEEWAFVEPYLILISPDAPQRDYTLRETFNALRWIVRTGAAWRMMPTNFPPWSTVHQQAMRWIRAGCFEDLVDDLREMLREATGKDPQPSAIILDGQTVPGTIESGHRAGYDGNKEGLQGAHGSRYPGKSARYCGNTWQRR